MANSRPALPASRRHQAGVESYRPISWPEILTVRILPAKVGAVEGEDPRTNGTAELAPQDPHRRDCRLGTAHPERPCPVPIARAKNCLLARTPSVQDPTGENEREGLANQGGSRLPFGSHRATGTARPRSRRLCTAPRARFHELAIFCPFPNSLAGSRSTGTASSRVSHSQLGLPWPWPGWDAVPPVSTEDVFARTRKSEYAIHRMLEFQQ